MKTKTNKERGKIINLRTTKKQYETEVAHKAIKQ